MTNRIANSAGGAKQQFELGTRGFVSFFASANCITETDQARACIGEHGRLESLHAVSRTGRLLPDPVRAWWHGLEDKKLDASILDINKVH